ncbi:GyrI-like domain-containing protein [Lachnospiraceae bacterium 38-14]|jgi:hypothetical protein
MKHEWKKHEKEIYGVKAKPCVLDIPAQKYIILSGSGNPNDEIFSDKVATLFSIAYKIKMAYKTLAEKSNEITDYTVYPLEGIWSTASEKGYLVKEELQYRIMIRQPDFITREMFDNSLEAVKSKKYNPYLTDVSFETICDGMCIQVLHKGAFDDEPASFEIMDRYCMEHGYRRMGKEHREIYLNNANRTEKVNLKTILRYKVTDIENILL